MLQEAKAKVDLIHPWIGGKWNDHASCLETVIISTFLMNLIQIVLDHLRIN